MLWLLLSIVTREHVKRKKTSPSTVKGWPLWGGSNDVDTTFGSRSVALIVTVCDGPVSGYTHQGKSGQDCLLFSPLYQFNRIFSYFRLSKMLLDLGYWTFLFCVCWLGFLFVCSDVLSDEWRDVSIHATRLFFCPLQTLSLSAENERELLEICGTFSPFVPTPWWFVFHSISRRLIINGAYLCRCVYTKIRTVYRLQTFIKQLQQRPVVIPTTRPAVHIFDLVSLLLIVSFDADSSRREHYQKDA